MNKRLIYALLGAFGATMMTCCSDNGADEAYYTFTGNTVASYCLEQPELYSTFSSLLKDTGTEALLSSYGHYTAFIPDNNAFETYFRQMGLTYEQLSTDQKAEIVYNHIINSSSTDYTSEKFEEGALAEPTMSDNFIVISYKTDSSGAGLVIYVNKDVPILERDIEVHNGIAHHVGAVINPTKEYVCDIIDQPEITGNQNFSLFSQALKVTHLCDSLKLTYDLDYVCPSSTGIVNVAGFNMKLPSTKRYGFTVFAETDEVYAQEGITSLSDLEAYARRYYDNGSDDYTSRDNALNKFVAYHLLDRQMSTNSFLYSGPNTTANSMKDRHEFYETMYEFHIIRINVGGQINTRQDGRCVKVNEGRSNLSGINGYVHSLENILVYDREVMENDVLNCRIRFDLFAIPPELTNNNIRWQLEGMEGEASGYSIPYDFCSKHLSFTKETGITMWASRWWDVYQSDEMKLTGWYDFTLRMLPVPPGSYEVRVGYRPETWRGIAQFFIDGEIQGIPRDLRIFGTDPMVGWQPDTGGPSDAELDKAMRNRGYMKGPASMWSMHDSKTFRASDNCLRLIIGTVTFQDYGAHYLRAKNVYADDREYNGDYIELIPTNLIDKEDIY